ncbi:MAG: polysaccharide deacetylase family protein [Bacteroidetes bacterium]|nr:polysaccharide deacetylase family protein [Bacteroidota bacterium]
MLVYTDTITPRIRYVFEYLFEKTGIPFILTTNDQEYFKASGNKINYSDKIFGDTEFQIIPSGLLYENNIQRQTIEWTNYRSIPVCFPANGNIGFDLPAAIFFHLCRYEEYEAFTPDTFGRYPHHQSTLFQNNLLHRPLIEEWLQLFTQLLIEYFPQLSLRSPGYSFIPTYDIDIAWSYQHKGFWRNLAGGLKNPNSIIERMQVLLGNKKDPYDCYDTLHQLHAEHQCKPIYFFPVGKKRSGLDRHISIQQKAYRQLIKTTAQNNMVGLHPSIYSHTHPEALAAEKEILENIIQRPVIHSRQHYLLFSLPNTYRSLESIGIANDYSMGYGTLNGFRAATAQSFLWYDLERERATSLRIHPLAWMDANSFYENELSSAEAAAEWEAYRERIQATNGTMITVSHNHLLSDNTLWPGWMKEYERLIAHRK